MTERGISTVIDVTLCLALISVAVGVFVYHTPEPSTPVPDPAPIGTMLARTTETLTYTPTGTESTHHHHGTLAQLLATAAVTNATTDDTESYTQAVENATAAALTHADGPVAVTAAWEPETATSVTGAVRVGPHPPPTASVRTSTITVPLERTDTNTLSAEETILPPRRVAPSRQSPGPDRDAVAAQAAALTTTVTGSPPTAGEQWYRQPQSVTYSSADTGTVTLTVETWSE